MHRQLFLSFLLSALVFPLDYDKCQLVHTPPRQTFQGANTTRAELDIFQKLMGNADRISRETFIQFTSQIIRKQDVAILVYSSTRDWETTKTQETNSVLWLRDKCIE